MTDEQHEPTPRDVELLKCEECNERIVQVMVRAYGRVTTGWACGCKVWTPPRSDLPGGTYDVGPYPDTWPSRR